MKVKRLIVKPPGPEGRFTKQWKWIPELRRLENKEHGAAVQVVDAVDEETGDVEYEGMVVESRRGELHVVIREDDLHFGFVFHRRYAVIPPDVSLEEFRKDPCQILSVLTHGHGIEEYEASHGLARNRLEEVLEEIGLKVRAAELIGFVNVCPSLTTIAHELFAVEVGRESSGKKPEPTEEIHHVRFFPAREVRNIQTICGLTQAALWRFRSWGLAQNPTTLWRKAAEKL